MSEVSLQAREFLIQRRQSPSFGATEVDLGQLRAIMATRREPDDAAVQCRRVAIDDLTGQWVLAPGADPDKRLLYLHGGGYVSGSSAFYLPLAAAISSAARCAVLLIDYRLAPEYPFPAALEDSV